MHLLRSAIFSGILFIFALFISFGNLFRLIQTSLFSDSLIVTEACLYVSVLIGFFFIPRVIKRTFSFLAFSLPVACSFFYGMYLQGFDLHAGLYAARLIASFGAVSVLAEVCFDRYRGSVELFFKYLTKAFALSLFLGFVLYIFFPDSEKLWLLLDRYHVGFQGDPHIGRFVSVYFDPNYYACIAVLFFLISYRVYEKTGEKRYGILSFLCIISGFLSWSRSGIALLIFVLCYMLRLFIKRERITKEAVYLSGFFCSFFVFYMAVYFEEAFIFFERVLYFFEDESALCRLRTFLFGLELFAAYPLFGVGINFLYRYTRPELGLNSLDSSLLCLLIQIGSIPFLGLTGYGVYKFLVFRNFWLSRKEKLRSEYAFLGVFFFYGLSVVLFAGQFNNVLLYPFWMIPFGVVSLFLIKKVMEEPSSIKEGSKFTRRLSVSTAD